MLAWTVAVLLLAAEAAPAPETRTLQLWVSDAKGRPIDDLTANEIAVRQDGKARPVVSVERETGPLTVALVVDTSAVFDDSFRSQLRPALEGFVRRLPAGTRFCVWTSGDRPTRWVDWTTDADAAGAVLGRIAPTGGNLLFETIDEALGDLGDARGGRATLVIVTGLGTEFSVGEQPRAFEERERRAGVVIHAVQIAEPPLTFQRPNADESQSPFRRRANYERALGRLTEETGGRYERILSSLGVDDALKLVSGDLSTEYRLTFAPAPKTDPARSKLSVKVARPKVRSRIAPISAAR